jgi:menaquinone-dependent protoporphyrinogen oxidase
MRVLVVYASKRGGTAGLAEHVGDDLRQSGMEVEVEPVEAVRSLAGYEAVIVGGALYAMRWVRAGRRFVKRNRTALRAVPVWMFSSGPLDDSAAKAEIPPTPSVRKLMDLAGARGHMTFGGRLTQDARGFPASAMAKKHAGDWRDPDHVARWVATIVDALQAAHVA